MIPRIDPEVKYVGTTYLRTLNFDKLRGLAGAVVVQAENSQPLAVILPYETYLKMQEVAKIGGAHWTEVSLGPDPSTATRSATDSDFKEQG